MVRVRESRSVGTRGVRLLRWAAVGLGLGGWLVAAEHRGSQFFGWEHLNAWRREGTGAGTERVFVSPEFKSAFRWNELVLSWNAETPAGTGVKLEVRAIYPDRSTEYYPMGFWTTDRGTFGRTSATNRPDADGEVRTDTLVLREPGVRAQVRLTLYAAERDRWPRMKFVGLSVLDTRAAPALLPPERAAWGKTIDVPQRSQVDYPEGVQGWCSPASVSMVLAYWAKVLGRPQLDRTVPAVAQGVFGPNWQGTGNWSFNTAFAGSFPGLRAYVTRLTDVSELEEWIAEGIPVVVSVCYDRLRGRPPTRDGGHLVVCVGFTAAGDVIVNDPGTREGIRRTFPRGNLIKAWPTPTTPST